MQNDGFFKDAITIATKINPAFGEIIQYSIEYVPYLGKIYQTIKINRLISRFNEHADKLNNIGQLSANSTMSSDYINERIFPVVFSDLFEEHEDAKINLILTGFENVFIEENKEESLIINYYDTLRMLRYADIKRLYYFSNIIKDYPFYINESNEHVLVRSIDKKLEYLGLIMVQKIWGDFDKETELNKDRVKITLYGDSFLRFILEKEELKEYLANR